MTLSNTEQKKADWEQAYKQAEWFREQYALLAAEQKKKGPKPKYIVTLDPAVALKAAQQAMREGENVQTIIRRALYEYLERNQR